MMSDLIDKQAVIDALYDWREHSMTDAEAWHLKQVIFDIKFMPSLEIIRCKDCKHSHMTIDGLCKYCDIWFPNEKMYVDGKHFCASAEKRML